MNYRTKRNYQMASYLNAFFNPKTATQKNVIIQFDPEYSTYIFAIERKKIGNFDEYYPDKIFRSLGLNENRSFFGMKTFEIGECGSTNYLEIAPVIFENELLIQFEFQEPYQGAIAFGRIRSVDTLTKMIKLLFKSNILN